MSVLAADVGGTHCRLALVDREGNVTRSQTHASAEHAALQPLIEGFVEGHAIEAAGIGVAGPVVEGRAKLTNLPWSIDASALGAALGVAVCVVNDLHAIASGVRELQRLERGLALLRAGSPRPGARLIVGLGTGLGKAVDSNGTILGSEGGHAEIAPRDEREWALRERWSVDGRTTVETLLSGSGLGRIHAFLTDRAEPLDGAEVSRLASKDARAREAVEWLVSLFGSEVGNQALHALPSEGVFLAGGIPPKLHDLLGDAFVRLFVDAFDAKPPMRELLEAFPITLVRDGDVGLLGSAALARSLNEDP